MHFEMNKVYWHLLQKGKDESLNDVYFTLDNLMKQHTTAGLGHKMSASVVSIEAEDKMWKEGILGESHL